MAFEVGDNLRRCTAGVVGLVFEAVPQPGVVAGGDDDSPARVAFQDVVAHDRRRHDAVGEVGVNAVRCDDARSLSRKLRRAEAWVVSDDYSALGKPLFLQVRRNSCRAHPDVVERVIAGDERPPAVGTESDERLAGHR